MLVRNCELNEDNVGDWGSGTLKKFRRDLEDNIINGKYDVAYQLKLLRLINTQIAYENFEFALCQMIGEMNEDD